MNSRPYPHQTQSQNLRDIPKVELHRHLDCSIRPATLRELLVEQGVNVPADPAEFAREYLVLDPMRDLESVLRKFLAAQRVLSTREVLARVTRECIADASAEGIRILELRYAPTFVQDGHPDFSFDAIHAGILDGIAACAGLPIAVGLIGIIQRTKSLGVADQVADFVIANKSTFVGIDLADNEDTISSLPFAPVFRRAREAGLRITIHAGEASHDVAPQNVIDAIQHLGAERIGHGIQILRDPRAMDVVRRARVPLEICPTSNWLTNSVPSVKDHPITELINEGISVTINSDDPGVFNFDLTHEYEALAREQEFDINDFDLCNDIAASASFIPFRDKQKVWPRPIDRSLVPQG